MRLTLPAAFCVLLLGCSTATEPAPPPAAVAAPTAPAAASTALLSPLIAQKRGDAPLPPEPTIAGMEDAAVLAAAASGFAAGRGNQDAAWTAARMLELLLARKPQDPAAMTELARFALFWGETERAGRWLDAVLEQAPNFAPAHLQRAALQLKLGQPDVADAELERTRALGLRSPEAALLAAEVLLARHDFTAALAACDAIVAAPAIGEGVRASAHYCRIAVLNRGGDHDGVDASYRALQTLQPDDAWHRGNYAYWLCTEAGRCEEAAAQARAALERMPYPMARDTLSMALYAQWARVVAAEGEAAPAARRALADAKEVADVDVGVAMARYGGIADNAALVRALVGRGVDIDARDPDDGFTALAHAAQLGNGGAVRVLLAAGADPNFNTGNGDPPLALALASGRIEVVQPLLDAGAVAGPPARMRADAARDGHGDLAAWLDTRFPDAGSAAP